MENLTPISRNGKEFSANKNWGMFGFKGYCIDLAIEMDDDEAIKEAIRRDWIDKDTDTTFSTPILRHCINKGKARISTLLKELGFPM